MDISLRGFDSPHRREGGQGLICGKPGAWPGGILLADDPDHLGKRSLFQSGGVKWPESGEQFVEDDPRE